MGSYGPYPNRFFLDPRPSKSGRLSPVAILNAVSNDTLRSSSPLDILIFLNAPSSSSVT